MIDLRLQQQRLYANSADALIRDLVLEQARLSPPTPQCYSACMADSSILSTEAAPSPAVDHSRRQLEALLDVSKIIAQHRDLKTLFHELAARLHSIVESDFLTLVLHDPDKNTMRLHVLETRLESDKPVGT